MRTRHSRSSSLPRSIPAARVVAATMLMILKLVNTQKSFGCNEILKSGVFNTFSRNESAFGVSSAQQAACQDYSSYTYNEYIQDTASTQYRSRSESFNLAVGVTFRFGLFRFGAGVSTSSSSSSTTLDEYSFYEAKKAVAAYRSAACSSSSSSSAGGSTLEILEHHIEPVVYEAYLRCLEMSEKGLQIATAFGIGGNSVDLNLRFLPSQAGAKAHLVDVTLYPEGAATCRLFKSTRNPGAFSSAGGPSGGFTTDSNDYVLPLAPDGDGDDGSSDDGVDSAGDDTAGSDDDDTAADYETAEGGASPAGEDAAGDNSESGDDIIASGDYNLVGGESAAKSAVTRMQKDTAAAAPAAQQAKGQDGAGSSPSVDDDASIGGGRRLLAPTGTKKRPPPPAVRSKSPPPPRPPRRPPSPPPASSSAPPSAARPLDTTPVNPFDIELQPLVYYTVQCRVNENMIGKPLPSGHDIVEISIVTTVANTFRTQLFTAVPPTVEEARLAERISALEAALPAKISAAIAALNSSFSVATSALLDTLTAHHANMTAEVEILSSSLSTLGSSLTRLADVEAQATLTSHVVGNNVVKKVEPVPAYVFVYVPAGFPDPIARFIWSRTPDNTEEFPSIFSNFTVNRTSDLSLYILTDDYGQVFIDGEYKGQAFWPNVAEIRFQVFPGFHTVVVRTRNIGGGQGMLLTLKDVGTGLTLLRSDYSWRFASGPMPGWTCRRPDSWCIHQTQLAKYVDCDGDGDPDWTCSDSSGSRWALLTTKGCSVAQDYAGNAPISACPAVFR